MSLFGSLTIVLVIFFVIASFKNKQPNIFLLLIPLYIQIIFLIGNMISLLIVYTILSIFVFFMWLKKMNMEKRKSLLIICIIMLFCTFTAEFLNGVTTFKDKNEFFTIKNKINKYHWLFPVKIYRENTRFGERIYTFSIQQVASSRRFLCIPDFGAWIVLKNGEVYYYKNVGKLGQVNNGYWYKYGTNKIAPGQI